MKLTEIHFPVYKLRKTKPNEKDGVLFYSSIDAQGIIKYQIIDDKTVSSNTLAGRRLVLLTRKVKLYRINTGIFFLGDLIKISNPTQWFIDSSGKVFKYTKSIWVKLECRKITNVIRSIGNVFIEVHGLPQRFSCLFPPKIEEKYAGIIRTSTGPIFYGFHNTYFKPVRRKI